MTAYKPATAQRLLSNISSTSGDSSDSSDHNDSSSDDVDGGGTASAHTAAKV